MDLVPECLNQMLLCDGLLSLIQLGLLLAHFCDQLQKVGHLCYSLLMREQGCYRVVWLAAERVGLNLWKLC